MRIEVQNVSKFRSSGRVGDDVPVILPGVMFGVFDGATDPLGTVVDGMGAGRLAALTVASAAVRLALDPGNRRLPGTEIIAALSTALAAKTAPLKFSIPPSTTVAIALACGETWRFLVLGDTGIRLNGTEMIRREKIIDAISTHARVAIFNDLVKHGDDLDATERATRRAILLGLESAVAEKVLSAARATQIIEQAIDGIGLHDHSDDVARFLSGGIRTQHGFGNLAGHTLGFDTLNGSLPRRGDLIDISRPKDAVSSIEIFSDGYPDIPKAIAAAAWEERFHRAEESDFHKIGQFASVKGSTSEEFFDDRTVVVVSGL